MSRHICLIETDCRIGLCYWRLPRVRVFISCPSFLELINDAIQERHEQVQHPKLKLLAESLPEFIQQSKAKSTTIKYYRGFDWWRSWVALFKEVNI